MQAKHQCTYNLEREGRKEGEKKEREEGREEGNKQTNNQRAVESLRPLGLCLVCMALREEIPVGAKTSFSGFIPGSCRGRQMQGSS